ncbi:hypothetical protein ACFXAH_24695, partial [Agrobacterium deltaense]
MLAYLRKQMSAALEARAALKSDLDSVLTAPTAENRNPSADEAAKFAEKRDAVKAKDAEIEELSAKIADLEEDAAREQRAAQVAAEHRQSGERRERVTVTSEPETYRKG